ncbi:histidine kinase [Bacillus sp. FJAT-52991]|uniref:Histidine kinase n=1 Tax=Bacillus kandeliae TaxID=3129297 RepID=A0ABZ2N5C3_9BACI
MKKKMTFMVPIMIVVAILAMWMLEKDYPMIDLQTRLLITAGAASLSGLISLFLLGNNEEKIDPPPTKKK